MTALAPFKAQLPRNSLILALGASLALHGAVLGAVLWFGGAGTPVPVPTQTLAMVMIEAPDAKPVENVAPASAAHQPPRHTAPPLPEPPVPRVTPARAEIAPPPRKPTPPEGASAKTPAPAPAPAPKQTKTTPDNSAKSAPTASPPPQLAARTPDDASPATGGATAEDSLTPPRYGLSGLANPRPAYPWIARERGEQGRVVVRVSVSDAGRAERVEVARSSGHDRLDRAALAALAKWRFEPARRAGRAVPGTVEVPVTFKLSAN